MFFRPRCGQSIPILKECTNEKVEKPAYGIFSQTESFSLDQDSTPAAFFQEDWLPSSFPWHKCIQTWFSPFNKHICLQTGSCRSGRVWNRQTGGQLWKGNCEHEPNLAGLLSFGAAAPPAHPQRCQKRLQSQLLGPWQTLGFSSPFPGGRVSASWLGQPQSYPTGDNQVIWCKPAYHPLLPLPMP